MDACHCTKVYVGKSNTSWATVNNIMQLRHRKPRLKSKSSSNLDALDHLEHLQEMTDNKVDQCMFVSNEVPSTAYHYPPASADDRSAELDTLLDNIELVLNSDQGKEICSTETATHDTFIKVTRAALSSSILYMMNGPSAQDNGMRIQVFTCTYHIENK